MSAYRIGYLNPWQNTAENQAFASLRMAAKSLGHELISVSTSDDILAEAPDFVLAVASHQPKLTHVPTFAAVHEPRIRYWEDELYFRNLLTYDGYLTIADSLRDFLKAFCAGFGKRGAVGTYYNTPQKQSLRADVAELAANDKLRLCYFGTNWDPRSRPLFRELSQRSYFEVRGPAHAWTYLEQGYFGSVPFDGQAVQATYARRGAGLVVLSRNHALDDVISNRIFEISSVGAAAICPDLPWIRKNFGDTVHYYDPWVAVSKIVARIDAIMEELRAAPQEAAQRADGARQIFERSYSAEVMIANAVTYFEGWRADAAKTRENEPLIDVVVRVGGRPLPVIARALQSIEAQTRGRFRVIFVRYRPVDLSMLTNASYERIAGFTVIDCYGGNRAATMAAGLRALTAPHFAVLDDDDFWLPDHIASLWRAIERLPAGARFGYSGLIQATADAPAPGKERRKVSHLSPARGAIHDVMGAFGMISFLASTALVEGLELDDWSLNTAEDTVLIGHLIARAECAFSWRATACATVSAEGSNFATSPRRREDEFEALLRLSDRIEAIERKFSGVGASVWDSLGERVRAIMEEKSKAVMGGDTGLLVLEDGMIGASLHEREDIVATPLPLNDCTVSVAGDSKITEEGLCIAPPSYAWAYGATIDASAAPSRESWVVMEFSTLKGSFGVGLLNADGQDYCVRMEAPRRDGPVELWLRVGPDDKVSRLVVQNWTAFEGNHAMLKRLWMVSKK